MVKNLPAMQETWVRSLGREDPLEKAMAAHSSTLAWRIPWTDGTWRATVHRVEHDWSDSACMRAEQQACVLKVLKSIAER